MDSDAAPAPQIADNRSHNNHAVRRCFVCLGDEPEATLPADWSTPCKCSLEGHQDCLLAWVADLEAQSKDVNCPVCKSPIIVTDRADMAIQLNSLLNRQFSRWSPKILLGFLASGALVSSSIYGAKAIDCFAGPEAAEAFVFNVDQPTLFQMLQRPDARRFRNAPLPVNLFHAALLPLIGPALVLNRMHLGEVIMFPASLIYTMIFEQTGDLFSWPPTPERVLALYPALRAGYFHLHRIVSARLDKKLFSLAFPGANHEDSVARQQFAAPEPNAGADLLDIEIEIALGGDQDLPAEQQQQQGAQARHNRILDVGGTSPLNFITGALLFPGVCYGVGELMRAVLPTKWVTRPLTGHPTGLLQERWGRSLVGGCLFVVLKDAFYLYVKYKKAVNRPYRKIKNSERRNLGN
ncbi:hypothetical protein F4778DRAFT_797660 [Xylariomycetidae sp. FL2044]|nr:hypothetical protein F4778DRAFT_797660 [Xylariomycetidae sp. FL2044]